MAPSPKARRWCFTLNNYSPDELEHVNAFFAGPRVRYGIYGRETGDGGTPHLQGFCILNQPIRFQSFKNALCPRAHLEVARGTSEQAADYCRKESDFHEVGVFPGQQGVRTDLTRFRDWIVSLDFAPSQRLIAQQFPSLFLRYPRLTELGGHLRPQPDLMDAVAQLNPWQLNLDSVLRGEPDDRSIVFYVDPDGGKGKSWFVRYQMSKYPDETQFLSAGKRDDLAYAIDETKRVFLFDLPRGSMEFFQYSVLEKLKDQLVFSSKYASRVKVLPLPVHVIVFCNEFPDMTAMTEDRYKLMDF